MELYQRQQFDFLLHTSVDRYVERLEQRNEGATKALAKLRANREGEGIWLSQFAAAVFDDFLIDNADGACFVLRALASRAAPAIPTGGTVEQALMAAARHVFSELLYLKTEETLEQHAAFEGSGE